MSHALKWENKTQKLRSIRISLGITLILFPVQRQNDRHHFQRVSLTDSSIKSILLTDSWIILIDKVSHL